MFSDRVKKIFLGLFPNVRAWLNFLMLWVFLLVLVSHREPLTVLVSGLGTFYCWNEWGKAMKQEGRSIAK